MLCEVAALPFQAHDLVKKNIVEVMQLLVKDHDINCNLLIY